MAFSNLVDADDVNTIIEMSQNSDWTVRSFAIDSMERLPGNSFDDLLINILQNDPHSTLRSGAARAIGYKQIKKAVPFLENALKDKDLYVRQNAFIALYILTDKKYNFDGKTSVIEKKAEREKQNPSF